MGTTTALADEGWPEGARQRAREVPSRLLSALIIALGGAFLSRGAAWPWAWFVAVVGVQAFTVALAFVSAHQRGDGAVSAAAGLSAASFAGGAALFWLDGGWGARPFAIMLLAGGAVNVALKPGATTQLLWAGCAPFLGVLLALPLISLVVGLPAERGVMGMTAAVGVLFVASVGSAIRRNVTSARRLKSALAEAVVERERADAAQTEKDDFFGLMSHELRTPLNGVLGMAQAMRIDPLSPEQLDRLDVIRQSGEALRAVLDDLLDTEAGGSDGSAPEDPYGRSLGEQRLRVLAAEDNPTNQLVLRTLLRQAGVEVHVVGDGAAAVEAWRAAHWDVVLMDIRMPVMDGLAATRAIRAAEAATGRRRTPIIAVSAETTTRAASDSLAAGIDCFVPKPIHFAQLATAMAASIEAAAGRDDLGAAFG